jgi:cytidyltransferase-like protein
MYNSGSRRPPPNSCLLVQHKDMLKSFRASSLDLDAAAAASKSEKASTFLPTSRRIVQFAKGKPAPPGAKVVYIDGGFDLFHLGHLEILKAAAKLGDYLLVGVHADDDVTARRGEHLPIMTVHERCLSVMACKHVDEVIIGGAPIQLCTECMRMLHDWTRKPISFLVEIYCSLGRWTCAMGKLRWCVMVSCAAGAPLMVSEDLLKSFNISVVTRGTMSETRGFIAPDERRYEPPRSKGIFRYACIPCNCPTVPYLPPAYAHLFNA